MTAFNIFYNLLLHIGLILLSPLWGLWMLMVPKVRAGFWEKLGRYPETLKAHLQNLPLENRVWLHAVSVGELNAAKPLIKGILDSGYPLVISTTTLTGHTLACKTYPDLPIVYFPFDLPWVMQQSFRLIHPGIVVIMETEIWPNLLFKAEQNQTPVILVNGRLSPKSFRGYQRFKWFFRPILNRFTKILMQSAEDTRRMLALGVEPERVVTAGNLKYDLSPVEKTPLPEKLAHLFQFPQHAQVIVFASSHKGEEEIFLGIFENLQHDFPDLRAVIAPRHPERMKNIVPVLNAHRTQFVLRNQLTEELPNVTGAPVIVLDTIGELNTVFTLSTIACMGGTFVEWGGHNPLEPINAHIPVVFGPSMENFQAVAERVIEAHAGFQVNTPKEAEQVIRELLTRPEYYDHIVRNGDKLMAENRGVTQTVLARIRETLKQVEMQK